MLLKKSILLLVLLSVLLAACSTQNQYPRVEIDTKLGSIEVELYPANAPKTVAAFLSYVDAGYYRNSTFYRVLNDGNQPSNAPKAEVIQGGIWKTNSKMLDTIKGVPHETTRQTHVLHKDGVISLARLAPGTANTEFFICVGDQPGFDYGGENNADGQGYAAFGTVVKGMDVVRKIYRQPEDEQSFRPAIPIYNITRVR